LFKEFGEYKEFKGKSMKVFRLEAVRTVFKNTREERDYSAIISVAKRIRENVLQEDQKLMM
jgi:hypothetical protein